MWLEIEALTPVHVGTGELLGPLDYAIGDSRVGVADLGRLFRRKPDRAEAIGQRLAGTSPGELRSLSLEKLLTSKELADETLWRYRLPASEATLAALGRARGQDHELRPTMKTPDGRAYLPGTSIKGALRTALIFAWSEASPEWARRFLARQKPSDANREVQRVLYGDRQDPNHDVLRALLIGDTNGVPPAEVLQVIQERVLSARILADRSRGEGSDGYKQFLVFLESVAPGAKLAASVRILSDLLDVRKSEVLGWTSRQRALNPQLLCDAANRMTVEVCQWELEYFGMVQGRDCANVTEFYRGLMAKAQAASPNTAYLCVGRGAGWHKLTPGILIARYLKQPEFASFREQYGLAAFGRFDRRDFVFPKSRKVVAEGERAVLPLGWVRLTFSEKEPARSSQVAAVQLKQALSPPIPEAPATSAEVKSIPPAPARDSRLTEAEVIIKGLKLSEAPGRVHEIAKLIGPLPPEERAALGALLRGQLKSLGFKVKRIEELLRSHPVLGGEA